MAGATATNGSSSPSQRSVIFLELLQVLVLPATII